MSDNDETANTEGADAAAGERTEPGPVLTSGGSGSRPRQPDRSTPWWRDRRLIRWVLIGGSGGVAAFFWVFAIFQDDWVHEVALAWSSSVICLALVLIWRLGGENGLLNPVIGADNRVSTSKTVTALWTLAIAYGIGYLLGLAIWGDATVAELIGDDLLDNYLMLLGGPFASLVAAKAIVTAKVESGNIQKITADEARIADAASTDEGKADLIDTQYLVFNMVAIAYFGFELGRSSLFPDMPSPLIGLTLVGAGAYLGNKAVERGAPVITSVVPRTAVAGQPIQIRGKNLQVGAVGVDDLGNTTAELLDVANGLVVDNVTPNRIDATIDAEVPAGDYIVLVNTNAGYQTDEASPHAKLRVERKA